MQSFLIKIDSRSSYELLSNPSNNNYLTNRKDAKSAKEEKRRIKVGQTLPAPLNVTSIRLAYFFLLSPDSIHPLHPLHPLHNPLPNFFLLFS
jgi:hypothetical protein